MSAIRRVPGSVAVAIGLFLLISPFLLGYPSKTQGVDDLTNRFRSTFSDDGLSQIRSDMDTVNAFVAEFGGAAAPQIAQALTDAGVLGNPSEFMPFVAEAFPDVAAGLAQFDDPILPYFNSVVDGLEANQHDFERADAIPTSWLPATSVHWILVIAGLVTIAVGAVALRRGGTGWVSAIGIVGLVLVVAAIVLQVPGKSASVDNLTNDFRAVFAPDGAQLLRERFEVVRATGEELQGSMVPALADALAMSPDQLATFLGERFPDVAAGLAGLQDIVGRFDGLVTAVEESTVAFSRADSIPTADLSTAWFPWHLMAPGLGLAVAAATGLALARRTPSPGGVAVGAVGSA